METYLKRALERLEKLQEDITKQGASGVMSECAFFLQHGLPMVIDDLLTAQQLLEQTKTPPAATDSV